MRHVAAALANFLARNDIDPDSVRVVLRCTDPVTKSRLEAAVLREFGAMLSGSKKVFPVKINGVLFSASDLDSSR